MSRQNPLRFQILVVILILTNVRLVVASFCCIRFSPPSIANMYSHELRGAYNTIVIASTVTREEQTLGAILLTEPPPPAVSAATLSWKLSLPVAILSHPGALRSDT